MNLVEEAISVTLGLVDKPEKWLNPEKGVFSRFINIKSGDPLRKEIVLKMEEQPIFEYSLKDTYSLITSFRVISIRKNVFNEKDLLGIFTVRPFFDKGPLEIPDPMKVLRVIDDDKKEFLIEFDAGTPTYFACMLITNLSCMARTGRWFGR